MAFDLPTLIAGTKLSDDNAGTNNFSHRELHNRYAALLATLAGLGNTIRITVSSDPNDWNPTGWSTAGTLVISASATHFATGLAAPSEACLKLIVNASAQFFTFVHDSASSSAANRILCPALENFVMPAYSMAWVFYDSTATRWVIAGTEMILGNLVGALGIGLTKLDIDGGTDIGAALADGDELAVYDLSATAPRKSAMSRVYTYIAGKLAGTDSAWVKIAESVLGSAAATFDFTSIPGTYRHLRLVYHLRGDTSAQSVVVNVTVNNDTGSNYDLQAINASGTAMAAAEVLGTTAWGIGAAPAATATANKFNMADFILPHYAGGSHKNFIGNGGRVFGTASGDLQFNIRMGVWRSTSAITRITLTPSAGNWDTGSVASLYGSRT